MNNKNLFLEIADKIGGRLVESAVWNGNKCTWNVVVPDKENTIQRASKKEKAGGSVYQGTAGIALFLMELFKYTKSDVYKKTAQGALNFSVDSSEEMPDNNFGFHSGKVGVAYVLYKASQIFGDEEYFAEGINLLKSLTGNESKDFGVPIGC